MTLRWLTIAAFVFSVQVSMPIFASAETIGVVLMHGKWGTSKPKSPIGKLKAKMVSAGFEVVAPDMPWSRSRYLAKSYEDCMAEIDRSVEKLKSLGATRIIVGGQSMGANVAMGYGARRDGLAGILAIAPGHVPGKPGYAEKFTEDVAKAKAMIEDGKGAEKSKFKDINQGRRRTFSLRADVYQSWFDPEGPAVMRNNTGNLKAPLLWIIGEKDRLLSEGKDFAYSHAPAHPKNSYVVIGGGHKETPYKGAKEIISWIKGL